MCSRTLRRFFIWAVVFAAAVGTARPAEAQSIWSNPAGGGWNTPGNWIGGVVPTPGTSTALVFGDAATQAASYTATNDIGVAGTPFDLNSLTFNNTTGLVTIAGNPLNFTGTNPTLMMSGNGNLLITAPVNLSASLAVGGTGTGGLTISGVLGGGTNNINHAAPGLLTLSGGGTLNRLSVQAGSAAITSGTLALTSPTGVGNVDAGLQLGSATGQTVATTISGGAIVNVTENTYIGDAVGSTGTLTVTGAGTTLNNPGTVSGRLAVGNGGAGTLNITNGGVVNTTQMFAARLAGGSGNILVDGAGSVLRATGATGVPAIAGQLSFGSAGLGTMTVQNGGSARSDATINIGRSTVAGVNGIVTVTGAGSTMMAGVTGTTNGAITVGAGGPGTLNVQNGAAVTVFAGVGNGQLAVNTTAATSPNSSAALNINSGGTITVNGNFFAAVFATSTAAITIDGTNSLLNVTAQFSTSGGGGAGVLAGTTTLNVTNSGRLQVGGNAILGQNPGGSLTATVSGTGTTMAVTGALRLQDGTPSLSVTSGAQVTATGGFVVSQVAGVNGTTTISGSGSSITAGGVAILGQVLGANGTLTVNGTGASFAVTGQLQMLHGTSSLNVQSGATVSATGTSFIGALSGASTATVTGAGSTFTTPLIILGGNAGVPSAGTANLTIGGGGSVTAATGIAVFSVATVNLNAGGLLSVGSVADGSATSLGTINLASGTTLNITDGGGQVYNGLIAGAGSVTKAGAGTQTFGGTNTYGGGTTITGGNLTVTNSAALGTGSIAIGTGATLGGTVTVTVPAGQTISGTGTAVTPLAISGTLNPGGPPATGPGILTASSNVTFNAGSTFSVTLNGTTPGNGATNHAQLLLSGTAPTLTLGNATLTGTYGFLPANTDRLFVAVITDAAGTVSGTFNGVIQDGFVTFGNIQAQVSYTGDSGTNALIGGNDVVLYNFTPVPEPMSVLLVCAAAVGVASRLRRRQPA